VEHFRPKGKQVVKPRQWRNGYPDTDRHKRLQRGCRPCAEYLTERAKIPWANNNKQRAVGDQTRPGADGNIPSQPRADDLASGTESSSTWCHTGADPLEGSRNITADSAPMRRDPRLTPTTVGYGQMNATPLNRTQHTTLPPPPPCPLIQSSGVGMPQHTGKIIWTNGSLPTDPLAHADHPDNPEDPTRYICISNIYTKGKAGSRGVSTAVTNSISAMTFGRCECDIMSGPIARGGHVLVHLSTKAATAAVVKYYNSECARKLWQPRVSAHFIAKNIYNAHAARYTKAAEM
jgi:hypothetical protein